MATSSATAAEREAAQQAVRVRTMVRSWQRGIDQAVRDLAARVGELAADKVAIDQALGGDSTRPDFTEQLKALHRQQRRFQALLDAIHDERL